ncbi:hypothetical protein [Microbacterium sp. NPDC089695]|uniref:hypothetical protein n=1 Tax=Microbacterium sp. NPDC089695 TaxID=3364198 RepID=UPI003807FE48
MLTASVITSAVIGLHQPDEPEQTHPGSIVNAIAPEVMDTAVLADDVSEPVQVPVNPSEGIELLTAEGPMTLGLPESDEQQHVVVAEDGLVGYVNGDGSSTVPLPRAGGALQVLTVIETPDAPLSYEYELTLPEGTKPILDEGGGVFVERADGAPIAYMPAPWATDAAGQMCRPITRSGELCSFR